MPHHRLAMESLATFLGTLDPRPEDRRPAASDIVTSLEITDPKEFCRRILESLEFRQYIMNGIVLGDLPPAILCRVMDHGWGKPAERVEHTGKDGGPVVTEVRRVIVHASKDVFDRLDEEDNSKARTH